VLMAWSAFRLGDTEFASSVAEKATARYGEIEFVTTSMARFVLVQPELDKRGSRVSVFRCVRTACVFLGMGVLEIRGGCL